MFHKLVVQSRQARLATKRVLARVVTPFVRGFNAAKNGLKSDRFDVEYHWYTATRHGECSDAEARVGIDRDFRISVRIAAAVSYFVPAFLGKRDSRLSLF